ncbi:hypothetical protein SG34_012635 [Thalassomonas viridans]|uniref:Uncharacterized protein n=1 Tax=Thalassomonas viridans TaxID=137584 RepID=A0AAE9Z7P3_9GAMM|nr:hypothetical protein [Thalassomonas viridans]WDE07659.1 hypothetical protein SG34_012635 [Thalassomonas viridans]
MTEPTDTHDPEPDVEQAHEEKEVETEVETEAEAETEQIPLTSEVIKLTDDFALFSADCAFLCDAFAVIASEQEDIGELTGYGLSRHAHWLKTQVAEFNERIYRLHQRIQEQEP